MVDLPTPPLPAPTAMMLRMPGTAWRPKPPRARTLAVICARADLDPGQRGHLPLRLRLQLVLHRAGRGGELDDEVHLAAGDLHVLHEPEGHDVLVEVGVLDGAQDVQHLLLGDGHGFLVSGEDAHQAPRATRASSTAFCSFSNFWGTAPRSFSRIIPWASMTNVVGKPAVGAEGIEQLVGAEELAVRDAVLAHEVLDLLRLAGGEDDAHHLDPARLVLAGELRVVRHLGDAGAAPGGPHVEHHDLALQRGQADPPALHRGQVERRRGARLRGLRRLAARREEEGERSLRRESASA